MHDVRWDCETELIEIHYEPTFFLDLPAKNVAAVLGRASLPEAANDPVAGTPVIASSGAYS